MCGWDGVYARKGIFPVFFHLFGVLSPFLLTQLGNRSCFALRIGNKAALLGKDLFAEVLVGGSLARCLCVLLMKGKGGEAERKEAGDLWKKCQKICAKTDNYSGFQLIF